MIEIDIGRSTAGNRFCYCYDCGCAREIFFKTRIRKPVIMAKCRHCKNTIKSWTVPWKYKDRAVWCAKWNEWLKQRLGI